MNKRGSESLSKSPNRNGADSSLSKTSVPKKAPPTKPGGSPSKLSATSGSNLKSRSKLKKDRQK